MESAVRSGNLAADAAAQYLRTAQASCCAAKLESNLISHHDKATPGPSAA
jgi:hypothetical protein